MDSALSWRFAARRSAPSMVVPLISAATLSAGRHGSALAGEFVRVPGLRCILWKGNNHSLQDAPCQERGQTH